MKENELLKIHEIENTPFCVVEEKKGVKVVMGNNLMTAKIFKNVDEATKYIHTKPWELIIPAAALVAQRVIEDTNFKPKTKK